ncbi:MAG: spore maturation protein [Clostridia bacterium]|nr:spore maturation protein [Clostridia bacterium]
MSEALLLPALVTLGLLCCLRAGRDVYGTFVLGAKEGLLLAAEILPYLCAILTAVSLLRETGLMDRVQALLSPALSCLGLPKEVMGVVLLRPISGSAALAAVSDVMRMSGADSRAARLACVISGASETVFFTGSLYLGAAGVRRSRYAVPVALAAYAVGVAAAAFVVA